MVRENSSLHEQPFFFSWVVHKEFLFCVVCDVEVPAGNCHREWFFVESQFNDRRGASGPARLSAKRFSSQR